jgi:sugar-specific transcriptional regulator TrmB
MYILPLSMENTEKILEQVGLNSKEAKIYLTLLELGPTAIRKIAEKAKINRGTTYESLKKLQKIGLVSYFHQGKLQHFVAENPKVLNNLLSRKKLEIKEAEENLPNLISSLSSFSRNTENKPVIKFYENYSGIRTILEDVLDSFKNKSKKEYVAYSSSSIRPYLYHKDAFPNFTEERIKRKIFVKTIAIGPGGTLHGKDDRKWLTKQEGSSPIYTLIYDKKIAMISVGENKIPHGLIIEDAGIHETERLIFDSLWKNL